MNHFTIRKLDSDLEDFNMKENKIRPSDFYWAFCMISTLLIYIIFELTKRWYVFIAFIMMFIVGLIIGHNKKIIQHLDYEKEVKK